MVEMFGRYRLDALIGRGGMGEVFRAYDTEKSRIVALKRLPRHLAADAEFTARFRRESQVAARLRDPHVIPIHDYGEIDGQLFIDMRLVEGVDLASLIRKHGRIDPVRAVQIVAQVASALEAAHTDGLVHRDVKPSNILLAGHDHVYLADFGIAYSPSATNLTGSGAAIGTVPYMAPERFNSEQYDHRVDLYALGCVLHEALTGRQPFPADGAAAQMYAHVNHPPPRPSLAYADIPTGLDLVVARAMVKSPDQRFSSAGEFAAALWAALTPPHPAPPGVEGSPSADPWRRRAILSMVVAALAIGAAGVAIGVAVSTPAGTAAVSYGDAETAATGLITDAPSVESGGAAVDAGGVGVAVRDGGVVLTVTSVRLANSFEIKSGGDSYTPVPAGSDADFVIVEAQVLNDGKDGISLSCGDIATAVFDDRERQFDVVSDSARARGNRYCSEELQPGFDGTVTWIYRVPKGTRIEFFAFRDTSESYSPIDETATRVRLDLSA